MDESIVKNKKIQQWYETWMQQLVPPEDWEASKNDRDEAFRLLEFYQVQLVELKDDDNVSVGVELHFQGKLVSVYDVLTDKTDDYCIIVQKDGIDDYIN